MSDKKAQIAEDLALLGVKKGDIILTHSSLKSLGGGVAPADFIDTLIEAVGEEGTVVFPTLSYMHCGPKQRVFDSLKTPSNVGAIPEYFRLNYPAIRSLCPTHSCAALGKQAEELCGSQYLDNTPCGEHSPFRKLRDLGGKVLFLGCGMNCNTSMHAVEETVTPPYLFGDSYEYTLVLPDGSEKKMTCAAHNFAGVAQCYYRLGAEMTPDELSIGYVLEAKSYLLDARALWTKATAKYKQNPMYFVDKTN